ncbi:DUF4231 domain-containing protein [Streptomyces sp. NBC_00083]|uniref:DUF4231 domain-containing protein n=1 Tax=Streptomyces sp. NBC_00083 TaxID=2975647 RepID=UPI002259804B|nr:DUF4231 domain-containing protein [Streptomyces sp. NBC_00083]MCX5383313.1 DUF4231 domain-containing protein [Streptomyces sp. NBC_00083]
MVFRNADLPGLFHHADTLAVGRRQSAVKLTRTQLSLLVTGALAAALPQVRVGKDFQLFSALSALAYAGVLLASFGAARRHATSDWQLNRSAAEFIKSMCWRYAVHGTPFELGSPDPDALFVTRVEEGLRELRKVGWRDPRDGDGAQPLITPSMRELRAKSFTVRKETYVRDRLIEQRNWYRRRQETSRRATRLWSTAITLLTLLALVLALLRSFSVAQGVNVAGVLSASAAACLAWSEIRRHQPLISAHALVEQDLMEMHVAMENMVTERQWPQAVYETERVVSPQHTDWLARLRS